MNSMNMETIQSGCSVNGWIQLHLQASKFLQPCFLSNRCLSLIKSLLIIIPPYHGSNMGITKPNVNHFTPTSVFCSQIDLQTTRLRLHLYGPNTYSIHLYNLHPRIHSVAVHRVNVIAPIPHDSHPKIKGSGTFEAFKWNFHEFNRYLELCIHTKNIT